MQPYIIIDNADLTILISVVNNWISQGYVPMGGISAVAVPNKGNLIMFAQAMVLKTVLH